MLKTFIFAFLLQINKLLKVKTTSDDGSLHILSVGMLLVEYFEHEYKRLGLNLFYILMTSTVSFPN